MTKKTRASAARPASAPDEVAAAYERSAKEIDALPASEVGKVTTDVPTAVSIALGALPAIESLVPAMNEHLRAIPEKEIGRLRERALALLYTHLRWTPKTSVALDRDLEEGRVLREKLLAAADAHVAWGQMNADAVTAIREGSGHLDRANDLIALGALFRAEWEAISEKTLVNEAQLERASVLGTTLVAQLGAKALGLGEAADAKTWAARRTRAFRIFVRDYDEIRRAVTFVRWHEDDIDAYTPSLHPRQRSAPAPEAPEVGLPDAET